jgi:uncharacterized cupredoxin-like copper-binding protein
LLQENRMRRIFWTAFLIAALASAATPAPAMAGIGARSPEWAPLGGPGERADRTVAVTVTATRYKPDALVVRRGETVRFVVTNRDRQAHEFVIGDAAFQAQHQRDMAQMPGMKMDAPNELSLGSGETRRLSSRFTRPGELLYACDLPGHAQAGMVGRIHLR